MATRIFSTGLPKFDEYVGGLRPGNSFLTFTSDLHPYREIVKSVVEYASSRKIPLIYLSSGKVLPPAPPISQKIKQFRVPTTRTASASIVNSLKRYIALQKGGSYIILDDLSGWKEIFRSSKPIFNILEFLVKMVQKKKSLLFCSCIRSSFSSDELARFKEMTTISLDLVKVQDEVYGIPASLKGRYKTPAIFPLKMNFADLAKQPRIEEQNGETVPASQQEKFLKNFIASDEKYRRLFFEAGEAMILFDRSGDYREPNKRAEDLLGYSGDEFKMTNPITLVHTPERRKALRFLAELSRRKRHSVELEIVSKPGKRSPVDVYVSNVSGSLYLALIRDISDRQKNEQHLRQTEEQYRTLVEESPVAVVVEHNNKPVFANKAFLTTFGIQSLEDVRKKDVRNILSASGRKYFQQVTRNSASNGEPRVMEVECTRMGGGLFDARLTISGINFQGKRCRQWSIIDISEQKNIIKQLTDAEEKYRRMVEQSPEPVSIIKQGLIDFVNQAFLTLFGFSGPGEITGKSIAQVVEESQRAQVAEFEQRHSSSRTQQKALHYTGIRKDGTTLDIEMVMMPVQIGGETLWFIFHHDVTGIRRAERDAHQRMGELRVVEDILTASGTSADPHKIAHASMLKVMESFSWDLAAFYMADGSARELQLQFHRNFPDAVIRKLDRLSADEGIGGLVSKTHEPQYFTLEKYPSYLPHRSMLKEAGIAYICFLPLVSKDTLIGMMMFGTKQRKDRRPESMSLLQSVGKNLGDVVGRAKLLQSFKEREEKYHRLIESSSEMMYIASPQGSFSYVNEYAQRLSGYTPKDFYRNSSLWLHLVHADDKKILLERISNLNTIADSVVSEYRILPKAKAEYRWVKDTVSVLKNDEGVVESVFGTVSDISSYRHFVNELKASNDLKTNILSSVQEGVVVFDVGLKCLQWNNSMERITGVKRTQVLGRTSYEILPLFSSEKMDALLRETLTGQTISSDDLIYRNSSTGREGVLGGRYSPLLDIDGKITGVVGILADISDRKLLEQQIRDSEHMLRNVIDTMTDVLVLTDLKGVVLQVNRTFLHLLGYSRSEAIGCDVLYPWLVDEEMGRYVLWLSNLREKSWLRDFDMTWKTKDGLRVPMSVSTTFLRNSVGEPIAILNIARDITERTRLGKDLENRNRQIELINRIITAANQTTDFEALFDVIAKEIKDVVPFDEISVGLLSGDNKSITVYARKGVKTIPVGTSIALDRTVSRFAIERMRPFIVSDLAAEEKYAYFVSLHQGLRSQMSLPIMLKGTPFGTLNIGSKEPHLFSEEQTKILEPISQEIGAAIERMRLFHQVSEDAAYIHNLLDSIDSIVYTVDTQYRIREVNRAWNEFMRESGELTLTDYHGKNLFEVLPSASLKETFQHVVGQLFDGTVRFFSQEFLYNGPVGQRVFQLTINPMIIDHKITGLVFTHTDITTLKRAEQELKRNNEQLLALNKISTLISVSLDLTEILQTTIPLLKSTLDAAAVLIYLIEPGTNELVLAAQLGFPEPYEDRVRRLNPTASATGVVVNTKEALYIPEKVYHDERILQKNREILQSIAYEAMAVIPLVSKDKVQGALNIFYRVPHEFSKAERQIQSLIGNYLGAAIENARLYGETVQKSLEIERRNKELDDFTYVVSHDLKEPLISIEGFSKILQSDYQDIIQAEGKEYLESIVGASTRMKGLIDDLLMLSRVSRPSESFKNVSVQKIVEQIRTDMEFTIRQKSVEFIVPQLLPEVFGNETQLLVVFRNLIGNAVKFNNSPAPTVEIGFHNAENNTYLFYIKDNGIGIDKQFFDKVFIIFQRLHRREEYEGTGAGLAIVKKIIEIHKGRIWVESEMGKGSTFFFTIPFSHIAD